MDTVITSASNGLVKRLRRLATSGKARNEEGLAIAEGVHLAKSLLYAKLQSVMHVCAESSLRNAEVQEVDQQLMVVSSQRVIVSDTIFKSFSTIHASVGVIVLFVPPRQKDEGAVVDNSILLDNIQDPGNVGTILRTAVASGVCTVLMSSGTASPWSPKALRAGMGAQFGVQIYENTDLVEAVKGASADVLTTTLSQQSESLYAVDLKGPIAWIFGNEGQGVRDDLISLSSKHIAIPQADSPVESLNVSAAAAVCLYEQFRQRTEQM